MAQLGNEGEVNGISHDPRGNAYIIRISPILYSRFLELRLTQRTTQPAVRDIGG